MKKLGTRIMALALAEDIRHRLPQQPPVVTPPAPQRPRRGIQRIR